MTIFSVNKLAKWQKKLMGLLLIGLITISSFFSHPDPAFAKLTDDNYDGNIFALYAGNGSLVPPKNTLAQSLARSQPAILFFYLDDSSDCKIFSTTVSQLQEYYGRAATFIPVNVDAIAPEVKYAKTDANYYYKGVVPQTVVIDGQGKVALDVKGVVAYEKIDDVLRKVFDLLPRSESVTLKRRAVNEINTELRN